MAAITWDDVTTIAPSLVSVSVPAQTVYLDFVNSEIDTRLFPNGEDDNRLRLARIYLAAHYAASGLLGDGTGGLGAGPVISESAGTLSQGYAPLGLSITSSNPSLGTTQWGRLYQLVMRPTRGGIVL